MDREEDTINSVLSEINSLSQKISYADTKESLDKLIKLVRDFFSEIFSIKEQFDFDELYKIIKEKDIDDGLKKKLYLFFEGIHSVWYSPNVPREKLSYLVQEFGGVINLILKSHYYLSKKIKVPKEEKKGFFTRLRQIFASKFRQLQQIIIGKERMEKLKKEKALIERLNKIIDQISQSIKNAEINHELIGSLYKVYSLLPKNKRAKVYSKVKKLFKEIESIKKSTQGAQDQKDTGGEIRAKRSSISDAKLPKGYAKSAYPYVDDMLKKGFDEDFIKKRLLKSGWSEKEIKRIIDDYMVNMGSE